MACNRTLGVQRTGTHPRAGKSHVPGLSSDLTRHWTKVSLTPVRRKSIVRIRCETSPTLARDSASAPSQLDRPRLSLIRGDARYPGVLSGNQCLAISGVANPQEILEVPTIKCPSCGSHRIHQSRRKGVWEKCALAMIVVRPFRCERCDQRFFAWSPSAVPNTLPRQKNGKSDLLRPRPHSQ
jgi:hypothetical protein